MIVLANFKLANLLGEARDALEHRPFSDFVYRDDQDYWYRLRTSLTGNKQQSCELRLCRSRSGGFGNETSSAEPSTWVLLNATLSFDSADRQIMHVVISDISALKQTQAELVDQQQQLRDANQLLEHRVLERTQALENARNVADAALRSRGEFLSKMSHEIRTPLHAISGMAELISRESLSPTQSERLVKLTHAGEHLLYIVNDILDMSKIDANKLVLEKFPFQMQDVLSEVATLATAYVRDKKIELIYESADFTQILVGDVLRLKQALLNYLSNAVKFTNTGKVTLCVKTLDESDASMLVLFEVSDTGVGVEPAALDRLFTPFEQADNATSRVYGGTGLGLSITRNLAQLMGGHAGARSVSGEGSTFWFSARFEKGASEQVLEAVKPDTNAINILRTLHAGLRVLVAEDDAVNSEIALILLEEAGLVVDIAEDGVHAFEMAGKCAYGLILMDMQMPHMDGLEATRRIRQLKNNGQMPIIAMTANAFVEDRGKCIAAGMDDFVTKPVTPAILYSTIVRSLAAFEVERARI
jgi:signal transduction histidine kinase/ActR/RegA family two-component response regulator